MSKLLKPEYAPFKSLPPSQTILIVVRHLIYGGTEKYTLNLANFLADKNFRVVVVTAGGPLTPYLSPKVRVFITPISRKPRIKEFTEKKIFEIAKRYKPQIIHSQCRTSMVVSQFTRITLGIPLITHEHHIYDSADYPYIISELEEGADKIITIGPYTKKELVKHGIKPEKIVTILNGVDTQSIHPISFSERLSARSLFNLADTDKVAVCLSRIERGKGIDKLAVAFLKIVRKIPNAYLFVVGDDQQESVKPMLRKFIQINSLQKNFYLLPGEYDIRKYHAIADVFCYPAIAKGMAVMEAMAAGIPVVGNKTVRKPLVVEHKISGLMTEPTPVFAIDPDQIAKHVIYLFKHPDAARKMGTAARLRVEKRYDFTRCVDQTVKVYKGVISFKHPIQPIDPSERSYF